MYIRQILSGHGISDIYHYSPNSWKGEWEPHHQYYTKASELQSWVYKTWAVVQCITKHSRCVIRLHRFTKVLKNIPTACKVYLLVY